MSKANLSKLLYDNHQSLYWMGFLLADGHFSKNLISVESIDKELISNLADYTETTYLSYNNLFVYKKYDVNIVPKIINKYDIDNRKTYNPPNFNKWKLSNSLMLSMLIGFIDGDGYIKKESISIKLHSSWVEFLNYLSSILSKESGFNIPNAKINNAGYASWSISRYSVLKFLKKHSIEFELVILNRKWKVIDLNYISNKEIFQQKIPKIIEMYKSGYKISNIAKELKTGNRHIKRILINYNLLRN